MWERGWGSKERGSGEIQTNRMLSCAGMLQEFEFSWSDITPYAHFYLFSPERKGERGKKTRREKVEGRGQDKQFEEERGGEKKESLREREEGSLETRVVDVSRKREKSREAGGRGEEEEVGD